jgi:type I restriction enzyme, S subunit
MELKPGYKQTEVGVIPEDWKVFFLGDSCEKIQDGNYGGEYPKSHEFLEHGIPFLTSKAIGKDGSLKEDLIEYISILKHSQLTKAHIELGDVLFTNRGASVGAIGFVDNRTAGGNIGPQLTLLRANPNVVAPTYLFQSMKSSAVQKQIKNQDSGSAMNFFGITPTKKFKLPLPPTKSEQEVIAEALSDADALIESLEHLIDKKRYLKQGAMQELLTGKKRLPGFEKKPGYKQTEVGVIPEDWVVRSLGVLCEIVAGRDLVKADYSPIGDYSHQFPIYSNAISNRGLYGYSKFHQYEPNMITVTARGDIGHAIYRSTKFCAIGRLLVLSAKRPCDLRFVTEYINNFVDFALESTGVPQLTAPQISKYEVALPPTKAEQEAIAAIVSDMDSEIAALETKLSKSRQVKQGMMQELLTGRIRLV